ncbi:unnamed protein product [Miscanthus lutarioriparius]|uniref:DUF6598 domain-containing protein n=1 Tax=Miscanthus lutarioriparius TaxID=422564 RepID=A0A811Q3J3_9POAL|nr:unnamed protein product [Miscanthus lutarioriparius]
MAEANLERGGGAVAEVAHGVVDIGVRERHVAVGRHRDDALVRLLAEELLEDGDHAGDGHRRGVAEVVHAERHGPTLLVGLGARALAGRVERAEKDSSVLPLISPVRGMSVWNNALVEINLKAKKNEKSDDLILIDSCIEFRWNRIIRDKKLKSRIDGPFGAFEMEYMFIKHGIEAVVEVDIPLELIGDHVLIVARSTGFKQEVIIYDDVVKEETRKISAVIVASHGGSLHFGFLATGIRASADFIKFQVKKSGSHEGYLFILKEPQSAMLNYEPHDILVVDSCLPRESLQLPQKKGRILALRRSANDPGVIRVPFKVTFSTMGYYNNGML